MTTVTFDDLARFVATDPDMTVSAARESLALLQSSDRYDLQGLLDTDGDYELIARLRSENTSLDGNFRALFAGQPPNFLIRFIRDEITAFVSLRTDDLAIYGWLHTRDDGWLSGRTFSRDMWKSVRESLANALSVIREAELNNAENVEFLDRDVLSPHGTPARQRFANKRVRTISLTQTRKQYLGGTKPHQGGTHARPVEHIRVLTERTITPKGRKPYVRKAKIITVNKGVRRQTRVTL
ncbi:hypothetical protein [Brevundimonas nasdae]|uniref:Uncharacterized protein n=1 Tax=Brevundimonas nasdae TaxID=172043 RepID=A0ACD4VLS8_9CAUL|nr:hypothetical protein [Brevundimonas nasdae]WOB78478.1 hypothetical protein PZA08_14420 [Brevundimonas nasdae]